MPYRTMNFDKFFYPGLLGGELFCGSKAFCCCSDVSYVFETRLASLELMPWLVEV